MYLVRSSDLDHASMVYHLAQLNLAKSLFSSPNAPGMQSFRDNITKVHEVAKDADGFIWMWDEDATPIKKDDPFQDHRLLVNMSVWRDVKSLKEFTYKSFHVEIFKRKKEWFGQFAGAYQVLWWIPEGHIPTLKEAEGKLQLLEKDGPTQVAFTFYKPFPPAQV